MAGNSQGRKRLRTGRREALKTLAASATALAAPALMLNTAHGQSKVIKIGFVSPATGPIAAFGEGDKFVMDGVMKTVGGGITVAGKQFPLQIVYKDSQSNPNRAAEVASQLINNDKCDILIASSTSDTVNPVADACELAGVPCVTCDDPWQAYFFERKGDPKKGFEWTYHFFWGFDDIAKVFMNMWNSLPTNKVVGLLFSNDPDGVNANRNLPKVFEAGGFKVANQGLYTGNTNDFSAQIAGLKKANAEIVMGAFVPPAFATFWTQCGQQGYHPKIATPAKALLFPSAVESLGTRGVGMTTEIWWSPNHPFRSGLTGQTSQQICDAYTKATKRQWTQRGENRLGSDCLGLLRTGSGGE